jgi:HSP20 family molecular chaperone IbpA
VSERENLMPIGRFARAVRLNGAFNIPRARAAIEDGELTVVLPKLIERRDQSHRIPIVSPALSEPKRVEGQE